MFLLSVFELSNAVEDAVTALEINGIARESIKAIPLESRNENRRLFDTAHYSDNTSTLAFPFILATIATIFGVICGFQLYWGPILWGFLGAIIGFAVGTIVSVVYAALKKKNQRKAVIPSVIVIVQCLQDQAECVKQILWANAAMGVSCIND